MKTVIFCGGKGTRMKEETEFKPKPMVEVGGRPILWHIMKIYARYGHNEFILPLGYKGQMIREYFLNHQILTRNFTYATANKTLEFHDEKNEDFKITFADTGQDSLTGERLLKIQKYIDGDEFMVTYGDGVSDIDINKLIAFHRAKGKAATVTAVHPFSKYDMLGIDHAAGLAVDWRPRPIFMETFINGGFMVFNKKIFDYLDNGIVEAAFPKLIAEGKLAVFVHEGFWRSMDTYADMEDLNKLWNKSKPWAIWEK